MKIRRCRLLIETKNNNNIINLGTMDFLGWRLSL